MRCSFTSCRSSKQAGASRPAVTAVALFFPIAIACYWTVHRDGALGVGALIGSFTIGAALMASPVVLLKIKDKPYFRQT
jgi:hypothetical protein